MSPSCIHILLVAWHLLIGGTSVPHRQPMIGSPLPSHPWEKVASNLFQLHGVIYLLVVDYFSRYMKVQTLTTTTSASITHTLKPILQDMAFHQS